ncbi:MAG: sulfite exporter TauE/SafE family protein [Zavarzinella sp.]|nr:sulfite exporter TauE/SafE family protein [Zavarzinella sp.]
MTDPLLVYIILCASAFAAGAVNSIAGGGTLLTFPALQQVLARRMAEDLASVFANATSTVALMPGSLAGALGYQQELRECRRLVLLLLAPSLLGGVVGSLLVTEFPPLVFKRLVPWLILTAAFLFLIQGPLKRLTGAGQPHKPPTWKAATAVVLGQFAIAVYGGYFGAGIGILMLSVLPFMGTKSIHETNAAKTILAACINGITVVIFILKGLVVWSYALAMVVAAIAGGYAGARVARRLPAIYVRILVVAIGFALGGYYLWKEFANGG